MTIGKKIKKLEDQGWKLSFDESRFVHVAMRGILVVEAPNITKLYASLKQWIY